MTADCQEVNLSILDFELEGLKNSSMTSSAQDSHFRSSPAHPAFGFLMLETAYQRYPDSSLLVSDKNDVHKH